MDQSNEEMAFCRACERPVSRMAWFCPACGRPIHWLTRWWAPLAAILATIGGIFVVLNR